MEFALTKGISRDVSDQTWDISKVSQALKDYFKDKSYGDGVEVFLICVMCFWPRSDHLNQVEKKYWKKRKHLEYDIKLSHSFVKASDRKQVKEYLAKELLSSLCIVQELKVKNFDVVKFRDDMAEFLKSYLNCDNLEYNDTLEQPVDDEETQDNEDIQLDRDDTMNEDIFWEIIDKSRKESKGNENTQLDIMKSLLAEKDIEAIIEFERILRRKIIELDEFNILAAEMIINGSVSDDSYLYFRAWIIGKGRKVYEDALKNADSLAEVVSPKELADFELLLSVSGSAYAEQTGNAGDAGIPADECYYEGLDYDFGAPPTKGEDWEEEDLPKICPNLYKMFNK